MSNEIADVVVVGAGIIGTCIAERLQYEGKKVVLIDRQGPGEACSKGNAGHFATDIILPLANFSTLLTVPRLLMMPEGPLTIRWPYFPKLMPWLMRFTWAAMPHQAHSTIEALKRLNRPSIERFQWLLQRTHLTELMTQKGALTVYQKEQARPKNEQHRQLVMTHGVQVEHLNGGQVRELEPSLAPSILGGLYYPDTAHTINPHRLVTALCDVFVAQGGTFVTQNVKGFELNRDDQITVITDNQRLVAKEVIVACGAYSKQLAKQVGHSVPLETERGYHLMLPQSGVDLSRPVTSFERSFVMTPMEQGLRLAGTVELGGLEAEENWRRADILFEHATDILPGIQREGASRWMGHRPSLPDSLPVIGRSPKHQRIVFAFGHQHLGLTQAAVTADLIKSVIFNEKNLDLSAYSITRF